MKHRAFTLFALGIFLACAGALWAILATKPRTKPIPAWNPAPRVVERVKMPVPPRFSAPLPTRTENFWEEVDKGPPPAHVRLRMLEGDREMGERYLSALRQAAPHAGSLRALWETYGEALLPESMAKGEDLLFGMTGFSAFYKERPPCEWLREHLGEPGGEPPLIRELFWWKLTPCPGPEVEALFARDEAPLPLVLRNYQQHGPPRLTDAMRNGVRRVLAEDRQELFSMATTFLAHSSDPDARELIEQLARQARGETAEEVQDSRTRLQRTAEYEERECRFKPRAPAASDALRLNRCLERWAREDWAATARLASQFIERANAMDFHEQAFASLTRFSSLEARNAWARDRGLLPGPPHPPDPARDSAWLDGQMLAAGRGLSGFPQRLYEPEFPVRHDDLLASLAWTARPELQGVVFEEVAPPWDEEHLEGNGDYTLRAYLDAERFSVTARNLEPYWDLGAVLALLNEVLAARGSSTRFAVKDSLSPVAVVLMGPGPALSEAHALGLLRLGDPSEVILGVRAEALKSQRRLLGLEP
jgi:hypothetical protein